MFVKSERLIDFLCLNKIYPDYEAFGLAHFPKSERLIDLIDKYTIEYCCIPNKNWS